MVVLLDQRPSLLTLRRRLSAVVRGKLQPLAHVLSRGSDWVALGFLLHHPSQGPQVFFENDRRLRVFTAIDCSDSEFMLPQAGWCQRMTGMIFDGGQVPGVLPPPFIRVYGPVRSSLPLRCPCQGHLDVLGGDSTNPLSDATVKPIKAVGFLGTPVRKIMAPPATEVGSSGREIEARDPVQAGAALLVKGAQEKASLPSEVDWEVDQAYDVIHVPLLFVDRPRVFQAYRKLTREEFRNAGDRIDKFSILEPCPCGAPARSIGQGALQNARRNRNTFLHCCFFQMRAPPPAADPPGRQTVRKKISLIQPNTRFLLTEP